MKSGFLTKTKFAALMIMMILFMSSALAQFSDSSTVDNTDPRYTKVTFAARLNHSGTLNGKIFDLHYGSYTGIYSLSYYYNATDDSVKGSITLKGGDYSSKLKSLKVLSYIDSVETGLSIVDTLPTPYFDNYQFYLNGSSGNGDSTYVYGTAKFFKKE